MSIQRILLQNFRNHKFLDIELDNSKVIFIYGKNGIGKTSILEAISMLDGGNGFRGANLLELSNNQGFGFAVGFTIDEENVSIECFEGSKKCVGLKELPISVLYLIPQDEYVLSTSLGERRDFFDRLIECYKQGHRSTIRKYKELASERLKLISVFGYDETWVSVLERQMADFASIIITNRAMFIDDIMDDECCVNINQVGIFEDKLNIMPLVEIEAEFCSSLKNSRTKDAISGHTSIGITKTDYKIIYKKKNLSIEQCSSGEQKIVLFDIIKYFIKKLPKRTILLLDDIFAKLDRENQINIINDVLMADCQVWITGTDLIDGFDAKIIELS